MNTSGRLENHPPYQNAPLTWCDRFLWGMAETAWDLAGGSSRDGTRVWIHSHPKNRGSTAFSLSRSSLTGDGSTGPGGFGN